MKNPYHDFLTEVIEQIDGSQDEKADIYEELLVHLQLTADHYIQKGYTENEAEQIAMKLFGESKKIGNDMQEAMFPLRKILLLLLALVSLFYSIFVYITNLFIEGDANIMWLFLSVGTSSTLLLFALAVFPSFNRKSLINTNLIMHVFMYLYGMLLASNMENALSTFFAIFAFFIIIFSIIIIYRTTIFDFRYKHTQLVKQAKQLHFLNITSGVFVIGFSLFFLWAFLIFAESFAPFILLPLIPITIWIGFYLLQMYLIARNKSKSAYGVATIPLTLLLLVITWIIWSTNPGGLFL